MPLFYSQVRVGARLLLNGRLHKTSFGDGLQKKEWHDYEVRIVRIIDDDERKCPILLGDDYSDQLGWVSWDELTKENFSHITVFYRG